jgi:hypothetical protein
MTITILAVVTQILIVAVNSQQPAVSNQIQLEIDHACLYIITIIHVQDCVTKIMVTGIHFLMHNVWQEYISFRSLEEDVKGFHSA